MKVTLLHIGIAALLVSPASAFSAQDADETSLDALDAAIPKPVVVKQEPAGAAELRDAVRRIAQQPKDSFALADAGYAAIKLGDYDAAFNFFTKANAVRPSDARIKMGLGIAQVRRENPFEALSLFDEALRLGASERSFAMDRALAYDLLGNFERAERDYTMAATLGNSDELTLRHSISLSLSGRKDDADRLLVPMLQRENPEAWRARALMLAARGDPKEAGKIASGFLPEREARRMDGYFRNMARLTVAQQAAAMHFGHFPIGSDIGEDSDSVRTLATATGAKPSQSGGESRLIPSGEPLGAKIASAKVEKPAKTVAKLKPPKKGSADLSTTSAQQAVDAASRAKVTTVSAQVLPTPEMARPPVRIALPALSQPKIPAAELPATGPAVLPNVAVANNNAKIEPIKPVVEQKIIAPKAADEIRTAQLDNTAIAKPVAKPQQLEPAITKPDMVQAVKTDKGPIGPGFETVEPQRVILEPKQTDFAIAETKVITPPQPEKVEALPAKPEPTFDLGALVESINVPDAEKRPSVAPVDLKKIKTAAAKPDVALAKIDPNSKAVKQSVTVPRFFVQVATGSDAVGLGYDYKRMAKKFSVLFAAREGWTAPWGKTRRLLVGPFPDMKAAKKWEADFRKAGGDGFVWQSEKNTEVEKLKTK